MDLSAENLPTTPERTPRLQSSEIAQSHSSLAEGEQPESTPMIEPHSVGSTGSSAWLLTSVRSSEPTERAIPNRATTPTEFLPPGGVPQGRPEGMTIETMNSQAMAESMRLPTAPVSTTGRPGETQNLLTPSPRSRWLLERDARHGVATGPQITAEKVTLKRSSSAGMLGLICPTRSARTPTPPRQHDDSSLDERMTGEISDLRRQLEALENQRQDLRGHKTERREGDQSSLREAEERDGRNAEKEKEKETEMNVRSALRRSVPPLPLAPSGLGEWRNPPLSPVASRSPRRSVALGTTGQRLWEFTHPAARQLPSPKAAPASRTECFELSPRREAESRAEHELAQQMMSQFASAKAELRAETEKEVETEHAAALEAVAQAQSVSVAAREAHEQAGRTRLVYQEEAQATRHQEREIAAQAMKTSEELKLQMVHDEMMMEHQKQRLAKEVRKIEHERQRLELLRREADQSRQEERKQEKMMEEKRTEESLEFAGLRRQLKKAEDEAKVEAFRQAAFGAVAPSAPSGRAASPDATAQSEGGALSTAPGHQSHSAARPKARVPSGGRPGPTGVCCECRYRLPIVDLEARDHCTQYVCMACSSFHDCTPGRAAEENAEERARRDEAARSPSSPQNPSAFTNALELMSEMQAQSHRTMMEIQLQSLRQQEQMMEMFSRDKEAQAARDAASENAAQRIQELNADLQAKQLEMQNQTDKIIAKIGDASAEQRSKIRTDVVSVRAADATSLFFELLEFEKNMSEMHITEEQYGLRWRALTGKIEGAAKGILDEFLMHPGRMEQSKSSDNDIMRHSSKR